MEKEIVINCGNIELEGILNIGDGRYKSAGVVIGHPHPQYGGNMHSSVVRSIFNGCSRLGFTVLRFNFRGVGKSNGSYADGIGEVEDLLAAVEYLKGLDIPCKRRFFVGYSFGAMVGLSALESFKDLAGWVGISPPMFSGNFTSILKFPRPKLVICGDGDTFCSVDELMNLYNKMVEPKAFSVVKGTDHFFVGYEEELEKKVVSFIKSWI
ncbi:MAG: alpha/beta fold hydrolase [Thermodesulfobacteriota bacterium]|nr:alpha/beta fold hydrolase [Thermodesulfobacteriota bacterium]